MTWSLIRINVKKKASELKLFLKIKAFLQVSYHNSATALACGSVIRVNLEMDTAKNPNMSRETKSQVQIYK